MLRWDGPAPGDPLLCLGEETRQGGTRPVRRLLGIQDLPSGDEAALRAGLPLLRAPGDGFAFTPADAPAAREEWRREAPRRARFQDREIEMVRLSRSRTWPGTPRFIQVHYALDPATGALLQTSGTAGGPAGIAVIAPVSALSLTRD